MTGALADRLTVYEGDLGDGLVMQVGVFDSSGELSAEKLLGPDLWCVLQMRIGPIEVNKGFLAQVKRNHADGLHFEPVVPGAEDASSSHWLYRGQLPLERSGKASVSRPSAHLASQCQKMLEVTPAAYVWLLSVDQVAVVGAAPVLAARAYPKGRRKRTELGTKRLDDFFVHFADCFIGDPKITLEEVNLPSLLALSAARQARFGIAITIGGDNYRPLSQLDVDVVPLRVSGEDASEAS